jgi:hypothetical protein
MLAPDFFLPVIERLSRDAGLAVNLHDSQSVEQVFEQQALCSGKRLGEALEIHLNQHIYLTALSAPWHFVSAQVVHVSMHKRLTAPGWPRKTSNEIFQILLDGLGPETWFGEHSRIGFSRLEQQQPAILFEVLEVTPGNAVPAYVFAGFEVD